MAVNARRIAADAAGDAGGQRQKTYSISDLAREFGVTLRTLRFYEDRGLLSPTRAGMSRIYTSRDRARLSVILKGKQLGFTLAEIEAMLAMEDRGESPTPNLNLSRDQIEAQIVHLERQRTEIEQALAELYAARKAFTA